MDVFQLSVIDQHTHTHTNITHIHTFISSVHHLY